MKKHFFPGLADLERLAKSPCVGCLFFSPMGCQIKSVVADYHNIISVPNDFSDCKLKITHHEFSKYIVSDFLSYHDNSLLLDIKSKLNFFLEDNTND